MSKRDWEWDRLDAVAKECGETAREYYDAKLAVQCLEAKIARRKIDARYEAVERGAIDGSNSDTRKVQLERAVQDDDLLQSLERFLVMAQEEEGDALCLEVTTRAKKHLLIAALNSSAFDVLAEAEVLCLMDELVEVKSAARNLYLAQVTKENADTGPFADIAAVVVIEPVDGSADYDDGTVGQMLAGTYTGADDGSMEVAKFETEDGEEIFAYPVASGAPECPVPVGEPCPEGCEECAIADV